MQSGGKITSMMGVKNNDEIPCDVRKTLLLSLRMNIKLSRH